MKIKNLFSFTVLAITVFIAGFFIKLMGGSSLGDIFSIPTASADVPTVIPVGAAAEGGAGEGGAGEGCGCEGSACG